MMFGILALFLINRSFWRRPAIWKAGADRARRCRHDPRSTSSGPRSAGTVVGAWAGRDAQPAPLAGAGDVWRRRRGGRRRDPCRRCGCGPDAVDSLGGSLSMRQIEAATALAFLNDEPWRWITGVGSATRVGGVTLGDIVGTPFFFPSDLGWLGVRVRIWRCRRRADAGAASARHPDGWEAARRGRSSARAVLDYAIFLLVVSPVVSVVLVAGRAGDDAGPVVVAGQNTSGPIMCSVRVRIMMPRSSCSDQLRM